MKTSRKQLESKILGVGEFPDVCKISYTQDNFKILMIEALNYASVVFDRNQLKDFAKQFSPNLQLSNVPDWEFAHIGMICWIILAGGNLSQTAVDDLNKKLLNLAVKYNNTSAEPQKAEQQKIVKTNHNLCDFEEFMDNVFLGKEYTVPNFSVFSKSDLDYCKKKIEAICEELTTPECGFDYIKASNKAKILKSLAIVLEKTTSIKHSTTKRIVRTRKINPTKMVKRLKYLKRFDDLGLVSVQPEKIIGSKSLWVYNTKTRKLGKYESETGLMVKGSTIMNYDQDKSISKKVRNPEMIKTLLDMGKVDLRKVLPGIKAVENKLNGRINTDTLLLIVG